MGAGISGGEPPWAHKAGARPRGGARPPPSWPGACPSCCVLSARYSQIFQKNHIKLAGHLENFYFWGIFYIARINQKIDRKILFFTLFQLNNKN